ncbi:MAG: MFS transporter, partial [Ruthenibacterium sp.]
MKSILKLHPAWLMLIACCFLQAGCTGILYNCAGIFFPPVCAELGFGVGELSFYMTMRGVFMMLLLPLAGRLLVRSNLRVLLSVSVLGAALAVGAMAFFTQLLQWYIAGAFLGIFGSFIFLLPAPIIIGNWFAKKSGLATGIAMACSGLGGAVMNPVGSYIIAHWGWRSAYLVLAGVCLLLVLPFTLFVVRFQPSDIGALPYGAS